MYEADRFVTDHKDWINKHMTLVQKRLKKKKEVRHLEKDETDLLFSDAMKDIPARVEHFAPVIGVTYGRITIRNQKTRWGSCSQKGNLNFNAALMLCPEDCRDYVVVHELCHRKEMNHSKAFWKLVEEVIPDYRAKERYLKEHSEFIEMIT
jgi:predicted metal-dependent hydrolase